MRAIGLDGSIWKGDLSTGEGEVVVSDGGNPIAGLDHDRRSGYLFAAGLITGKCRKDSQASASSRFAVQEPGRPNHNS